MSASTRPEAYMILEPKGHQGSELSAFCSIGVSDALSPQRVLKLRRKLQEFNRFKNIRRTDVLLKLLLA